MLTQCDPWLVEVYTRRLQHLNPARGSRSWRKRQQKAKAGTENARSSMLNGSIEMQVSPVRDTSIPRSGEDTELLSISRSGEYRDQSSSQTLNPAQDGSHE
jgi:hypothetical protein